MPVSIMLAAASDTGASSTDGLTSDTTPTFLIVGAANQEVIISDGNGGNENVNLNNDGEYEFTPLIELTDGPYTYTVIDTIDDTNADSVSIQVDTEDPAAPTIALASGASDSLAAGDSTTVEFTFAEVPFGFDVSDVTVTNGSLSELTATSDPKVFTATLTPNANVEGDITLAIAANRFADEAGNTNTAASDALKVAADTIAPSAPEATLVNDTGLSDADGITSDGTVSVTLENGATFEYSTDGGNTFQTGVDASFILAEGEYSNEDIQVRQIDEAGNTSEVTKLNAVTVDKTAPTAPTIALAADADGNLAAGQSTTVEFTFAEAPVGFTIDDVTFKNGTVSNLQDTPDPLVYTVTLTPDADFNGDVTVSVEAGTFEDVAGNENDVASTPLEVPSDATAPTFTSAAVNGATLTLTYSETLDTNNIPAIDTFTVSVAGDVVDVTGVGVNGKIVTLTLADAVTNGQKVVVDYADPTDGDDDNAIQDAAGNDAASLTDQAVTNNTAAPNQPNPNPNPQPQPPVTEGTAGDDNIAVGTSTTPVYGGAGSDNITATPAAGTTAQLFGGSAENDPNDGGDTISVSGAGSVVAYGNGGSDQITVTATGAASVFGGMGDDRVSVTNNADNSVVGGMGADTIAITGNGNNQVLGGSSANDPNDGADRITISGNGNNTVYANGGDDTIVITGSGSNTVYGGAGNDAITGGSGNDQIVGGQGSNVLTGGAGSDTFVFTSGGQDIITDFNFAEGDRIALNGEPYGFTQTSDGNAAILIGESGVIVLAGVSPESLSAEFFA